MANGELSAIARYYDELAPEYELQLAANPVAVYMRTRLQVHLSRVFHAGDRVLDLTAGTGVDARFLASRGVRVVALDISKGMIEELKREAQRGDLTIDAHLMPVEDLARLELSDFDGAISTFGGLNTVVGISRLARDLASCLKPGARVVVHALNDFCLWQTIRGITQGHLRKERETNIHLGSTVISHRFYNPDVLWRDSFSSNFALKQVYGLSVVAAPPIVRRFPAFAPLLFALDRIAGGFIPRAGDFFVMELTRRDG